MASNEELTRIADRLEGDIFDAVPDDNDMQHVLTMAACEIRNHRQGQITEAMVEAARERYRKHRDVHPGRTWAEEATAQTSAWRAALEAAEEVRRG